MPVDLEGRPRAPFAYCKLWNQIPRVRGCCGAFVRTALAVLIAGISIPDVSAAAEPTRRLVGILGDDDRVLLDPVDWPWTALGRLNRATGGFCTGVAVAEDVVLTAAHCLYDKRTRRYVKPSEVHFLAGYRRGSYGGHARAAQIIRPGMETGSRAKGLSAVAADWAIVVLESKLPAKPIPVRALADGDILANGTENTLLRAGYGRDRPHLLSLHRGCRLMEPIGGGAVVAHTCDAVQGDSGSPLLLERTREGGPSSYTIVGINTGFGDLDGRKRGLAVHAAAILPTLRRVLAEREAAATDGFSPAPPD